MALSISRKRSSLPTPPSNKHSTIYNPKLTALCYLSTQAYVYPSPPPNIPTQAQSTSSRQHQGFQTSKLTPQFPPWEYKPTNRSIIQKSQQLSQEKHCCVAHWGTFWSPSSEVLGSTKQSRMVPGLLLLAAPSHTKLHNKVRISFAVVKHQGSSQDSRGH